MADANSAEYYRSREQQERRIAATAVDPGIAAIHHEMADRYSRLFTDTEPVQPALRQHLHA